MTGPPPPPHTHTHTHTCTAQLYTNPDLLGIQISLRLRRSISMKVTIPFLGGGGVVSDLEEVETLGEAPPTLNDRLPRAVNN